MKIMLLVLLVLLVLVLTGCSSPKGDIWEVELSDGQKTFRVVNSELTLSVDGRVLYDMECSHFKGVVGARSIRCVGKSQ
jgi:hypothetical protein